MQRFAKPVLISALGVVIIYAAAVLSANIYLQSAGVQARLRESTSKAAGFPVEIRSTSYTPWSGLVVSGVVVQHSGEAKMPFLDVANVGVSLRTLPLFSGRFEVAEVRINNPILATFQKKDGSWSRPAEFKPAPAPAPPPPAVVAAPVEVTPPPADDNMVIAPVATPTQTPNAIVEAPHSQPVVLPPGIEVREGAAFFDDVRGRRVLVLHGIRVSVKPAADGSVTGRFHVDDAEIFGRLIPKSIRGTFFWRNGHLEIPDLEADWCEGSLAGKVAVATQGERRFSGTLKAAAIGLHQLAVDAGIRADGTKGKLFGDIEIAGVAGRPDTFAGKAHVELRSARFEPVEFVRQIGELLAIQELQMLELKTATADFTIADEKVQTDNLILESENLIFEVDGPIGFDQKLDLDAKLHLNDRLRRDLRGLVGSNLKPSKREGFHHIPFSVDGTLSRPKSNLIEKAVGSRLGREVGGLLRGLLSLPGVSQPKPEPSASPAP